jgi:hypothetical protein
MPASGASPLPTPFDIAALPFFPWEPGRAAWILLAVALAAVVLGSKWWSSRRDARSPIESAFAQVANHFSALLIRESPPGAADMERVSLLLRRLLSLCEHADIAGLTPTELSALAQKKAEPATRELLSALGSVDTDRYLPPSSQRARSAARERIEELKRLVDAYRIQFERPKQEAT